LHSTDAVIGPGPLAGRLGDELLSGHVLIVILAAGLLVICVLAVPVLTDVSLKFASAQGAKIARNTFLTGLCVLLLGLAIQVEVVDIIGAVLMGAVILGVILANYLAAADPVPGSRWLSRR
jgi:hypothetical protein